MNDIAVLTGGTVITEEVGLQFDKAETSVLGSCKKVIISKDDSIILDGAGSKDTIEERIETIRE